jgi:hypothetical protein
VSAGSKRKLEFVRRLYLSSLVDGRSKRKRYQRDSLIDAYKSFFGDSEGFSDVLDKLVYEKLIVIDISPSQFSAEYYLGKAAVDLLATLGADQSDSWTVKNTINLNVDQKSLLVEHIRDTIKKIDNLKLDQERKAQIYALLNAACILADAPSPPTDVITTLLKDVDRLVGIAGFLVGIAGLLVGFI